MLVPSKFKECVRINPRSWIGLEAGFLILSWGNHGPSWGGDAPCPKTLMPAAMANPMSWRACPLSGSCPQRTWAKLSLVDLAKKRWRSLKTLLMEVMQHPDGVSSHLEFLWWNPSDAGGSCILPLPSVFVCIMCSGRCEHRGTSIAILGSIQVRNQKHRDSQWLVEGNTVMALGFSLTHGWHCVYSISTVLGCSFLLSPWHNWDNPRARIRHLHFSPGPSSSVLCALYDGLSY